MYNEAFVASTSEFWWDIIHKASFGGCIANFMTNRYVFRNGMSLYMYNATLSSLGDNDTCLKVLQSLAPTTGRCQALVDFFLFDKEHTGEEVGKWLDDAHTIIGCKPVFIGIHTVDGADNAGKSVEILKWRTKDDRQHKL